MCPICGHGKLFSTREKGWGCNQCGYIIYRRQLTVMLDEKDVSRLVNSRLTESKVFEENLKGKRYHARLKRTRTVRYYSFPLICQIHELYMSGV